MEQAYAHPRRVPRENFRVPRKVTVAIITIIKARK